MLSCIYLLEIKDRGRPLGDKWGQLPQKTDRGERAPAVAPECLVNVISI